MMGADRSLVTVFLSRMWANGLILKGENASQSQMCKKGSAAEETRRKTSSPAGLSYNDTVLLIVSVHAILDNLME